MGTPHGMRNTDLTRQTISTRWQQNGSDPYSETNTLTNDTTYQFFVYAQTIRPMPKVLDNTTLRWSKYYQERYTGSTTDINLFLGKWYRSGHIGVAGNVSMQGAWTNKVAEADQTALTRLYDEFRGGLDLSIDLYQYKQTVALTESIFSVVRYIRTFNIPKLYKSYLAYQRHRARNLKGIQFEDAARRRKRLRDAGGLWLQYSYGIKPLVDDVYGIADELLRNIEPLMKVKGRARVETIRKLSGSTNIAGWSGAKYIEDHKEIEKVSYCCTFKHSAATVQMLSRFSTLNPVGFVWENTPFSFVVDWFFDFGGYLRNMESSILSSSLFKDGYQDINRLKETYSLVYQDKATPTATLTQAYKGKTTWKSRDRVKLTTSPRPRMPRIKVDFSNPLKACNAVSLLLTFVK